MKIVLSRKGFDSSNGRIPSPILPDGTMLSLPIATDQPEGRFAGLFQDGRSYEQIILDLRGNAQMAAGNCHPDPDLRLAGRDIADWRPAFGQTDAAQTHLENEGVGAGDLFLFFGRFRQTEQIGEKLRYVRGAPAVHAVFGYLQIAEILKGDQIGRLPWHPHASDTPRQNNTVYTATARLTGAELPGAGTLDHRQDRVLTAPGRTTSRWKLLPWMDRAHISYHTSKALRGDHFQSTARGQEFVVEENAEVLKWALGILN
ncbi:MAG: hypothetical protein LBG60_14845 [Bifidobacteriaceae bacterium]|jgi:hypothetical protein|nr:hypothetical protein [Bifidobacteriaceae bacterium]